MNKETVYEMICVTESHFVKNESICACLPRCLVKYIRYSSCPYLSGMIREMIFTFSFTHLVVSGLSK